MTQLYTLPVPVNPELVLGWLDAETAQHMDPKLLRLLKGLYLRGRHTHTGYASPMSGPHLR